jgi:hypothetical protein
MAVYLRRIYMTKKSEQNYSSSENTPQIDQLTVCSLDPSCSIIPGRLLDILSLEEKEDNKQ